MPPHTEQVAARDSRQQSLGESSPIPIRQRGNMSHHPTTITNGYPADDPIESQHLLTGMGACNCGCNCTHCHCPDREEEDQVIDLEDYYLHANAYRRLVTVYGSIETVNEQFAHLDSIRAESTALGRESLEDYFTHLAQQDPNGIVHREDEDGSSVDEDPHRWYYDQVEEFEGDVLEDPRRHDEIDDDSALWSLDLGELSTNPSSMYNSFHSMDIRRPSATPSMMLVNVGEVTKLRNNFLRLL